MNDDYEDKDKRAREYQREFAIGLYEEYWGVSLENGTLVEVDQKNAEGESLANLLDAKGGVDKIVSVRSNIYMAQRIRNPPTNGNRATFTIRRRPDGEYDAEYSKLVHAFENGGNPPSRYAYGQINQDETGFLFMKIVDMGEFLKREISGQLEKERSLPKHDSYEDPYCWENKAGSADNGFYSWRWQQLYNHGCIIAHLNGGKLVDVKRQSGLGDFAD